MPSLLLTIKSKLQNMSTQDTANKLMIAQMSQKNAGIGAALTLFFGGIGLFYATMSGGLIMTVAEFILCCILGLLVLFTAGIGLIVAVPIILVFNVICVVWALSAIKKHNEALIAKATAVENKPLSSDE